MLYQPRSGQVVSLHLDRVSEIGDDVSVSVTVNASGQPEQSLLITGVVVSLPRLVWFGKYGVSVTTTELLPMQ